MSAAVAAHTGSRPRALLRWVVDVVWIDEDELRIVARMARVEVRRPVQKAGQRAALAPARSSSAAGVALRARQRPDDRDHFREFVLDAAQDVLGHVDRVAANLQQHVAVLGVDHVRVGELRPRNRDQILRLLLGRHAELVVGALREPDGDRQVVAIKAVLESELAGLSRGLTLV
jgi:nitroreductase